jgi:peroxin-12
VLEASQLAASSATLAESFYGLLRAPSFAPVPAPRLPAAQVAATLLFTVVVPHAKLKLDAAYEARSGGALAPLMRGTGWRPPAAPTPAPAPASAPARRPHALAKLAAVIRALAARLRLEELLVEWYPTFHAVYEGLGLLFNVAYLFGRARYFGPALMLQRLVVRRLTARELAAGALSGALSPSSPSSGPLAAAAGLALSGAKRAFVASVFAFRFLEYYYAAESRAPRPGAVVPPPPVLLPPARGVDPAAAASKVNCPLCGRARVNAAACTASGYVFCYTCIYAHLDAHRACPVTLMPATTDDILRVYEQEGAS